MDPLQVGGPAAAIVTAFLSYLAARRMIRHEHLKEEARQAEKQHADDLLRQHAAVTLADQARAAVVAERDQLLGRWQQTLDEAREERRRLVEDHRAELARVRKQAEWEVERVRRESAAVIAQLRAQFAARYLDRSEGTDQAEP